jgi:hypothetical protein
MKSKILTLIAGISIFAASGVNAANQTFSDTQQVTRLGSTFTFSQFNSSLGSLTAVDLIINSSVSGGNFSVSRGATGAIGTNGTVSLFTQKLSVEDSDGNPIFTGPIQSLTFSGINSIPRNTTRIFTIDPSQSILATSPSNPISIGSSPWSIFIGTSTVDLNATVTPEATVTSGLGLSSNYDNSTALTALTLRYTYTTDPSPVPEPGQVAASLLLLGGIGAYVFIKRRKKSAPAAA